jgi:hypothetical protein
MMFPLHVRDTTGTACAALTYGNGATAKKENKPIEQMTSTEVLTHLCQPFVQQPL